MSKLLSIVIPTRNRQKYCVESIISILKELDDTCELVIQDNSSDESLRTEITKINDERIVYNYNSKALSFIDNFEEALILSTAKYFCILGDDDSVTKDILPVVNWMAENSIESVASSRVVDYIWPNDSIEKYKTGLITVPIYTGLKQFIDPLLKLQDLLKGGFIAYQEYNLPRTYHGIIKKSCMDEVKKISGRYFGGLTPDIYSTIALACVVKRHCIIDFPFSIAGACPASATVQATVGGHSGELKNAPHLRNRGNYEWEPTVPRYYSVETIWAETAIKALKNLNRYDLLYYFNKYRLYIYSLNLNRKYIFRLSLKETLKLSKNLHINPIGHAFNIIGELIKTSFRVAKKKTNIDKNYKQKEKHSTNILSLEDAKRFTNEQLLYTFTNTPVLNKIYN